MITTNLEGNKDYSTRGQLQGQEMCAVTQGPRAWKGPVPGLVICGCHLKIITYFNKGLLNFILH